MILAAIFLFVGYLTVGLVVCLLVDAHPRYSGLFDRMGGPRETLTILLWPLLVPLAMRGRRHG